MADDNYTLAELFGNVAQAIATRPQKSSVTTTTTSSTAPYAPEDMLMRRDKIGKTAQYLDNVLKERETMGYNMANTQARNQWVNNLIGGGAQIAGTAIGAALL